MCLVGFRVLRDTEAARRNERGAREHSQGFLRKENLMKARLVRLAITLGAIAATALAGGATVKGF